MHSERGTLKVVSDVGARIYAQSAHEQCGKECFAVCYRVKQQENLFLVSLQALFPVARLHSHIKSILLA